jgi:hypothetical protein
LTADTISPQRAFKVSYADLDDIDAFVVRRQAEIAEEK